MYIYIYIHNHVHSYVVAWEKQQTPAPGPPLCRNCTCLNHNYTVVRILVPVIVIVLRLRLGRQLGGKHSQVSSEYIRLADDVNPTGLLRLLQSAMSLLKPTHCQKTVMQCQVVRVRCAAYV